MPSFVVVLWDSVLVHPLVLGLIYLSSLFGAGFAIILFTIVTKTILLPLTIKQLGSQRAMTRLQPELKALQARYAKDK
ncbi:MAG: YidC/Oxa1 family membrane protein insertase, partial [Chloroflexota bacterium]